MQTEEIEKRGGSIAGVPEAGAFRDLIRANNKILFWEEICSELIDNALEHSRESVTVSIEWDTLRRRFSVTDDGLGANRFDPFIKPGKSAPTGRDLGNSTFGMGLYVIECCLSSASTATEMKVATRMQGGKLMIATREIQKTDHGKGFVYDATPLKLSDYGITASGTRITFTDIAKSIPQAEDMDRIIRKLGRYYGTAIRDGKLRVIVSRNAESQDVLPEPIPSCIALREQTVEILGNTFRVVWGVTKDTCRDDGCRLIYGGKFFDTTKEPCGDALINRFFAEIYIPRTIGKQSMDILKRSVEHESMDTLYDQLAELFDDELRVSTELCSDTQSAELSDSIASLLSHSLALDENGNAKTSDEHETRKFNGRDNTKTGIQPVGTKRKRRGRRVGKTIPSKLLIQWAQIGSDRGLAVYDDSTFRVTFNSDIEVTQQLKRNNDAMQLASIAATHIAHDIESDEKQKRFGFSEQSFESIYRTMMERICNTSKQ